jgi:hypothetical protein
MMNAWLRIVKISVGQESSHFAIHIIRCGIAALAALWSGFPLLLGRFRHNLLLVIIPLPAFTLLISLIGFNISFRKYNKQI